MSLAPFCWEGERGGLGNERCKKKNGELPSHTHMDIVTSRVTRPRGLGVGDLQEILGIEQLPLYH